MKHFPTPSADPDAIGPVGSVYVVTPMRPSSPDQAPKSFAIEEAVAEHRGEPILAIRVGYEEWNDFCRERRLQPDEAWDVRFLGFPITLDDEPTGVRLITEG
jgi:hypothetical protein